MTSGAEDGGVEGGGDSVEMDEEALLQAELERELAEMEYVPSDEEGEDTGAPKFDLTQLDDVLRGGFKVPSGPPSTRSYVGMTEEQEEAWKAYMNSVASRTEVLDVYQREIEGLSEYQLPETLLHGEDDNGTESQNGRTSVDVDAHVMSLRQSIDLCMVEKGSKQDDRMVKEAADMLTKKMMSSGDTSTQLPPSTILRESTVSMKEEKKQKALREKAEMEEKRRKEQEDYERQRDARMQEIAEQQAKLERERGEEEKRIQQEEEKRLRKLAAQREKMERKLQEEMERQERLMAEAAEKEKEDRKRREEELEREFQERVAKIEEKKKEQEMKTRLKIEAEERRHQAEEDERREMERKLEEERKLIEAERKKREEEMARRKAEEAEWKRKKKEELRRKQEEIQKRKEEEIKRMREEAHRKKVEEEERKIREAEEKARLKREKEEEERRSKDEAESKRKKEAEERIRQRQEKEKEKRLASLQREREQTQMLEEIRRRFLVSYVTGTTPPTSRELLQCAKTIGPRLGASARDSFEAQRVFKVDGVRGYGREAEIEGEGFSVDIFSSADDTAAVPPLTDQRSRWAEQCSKVLSQTMLRRSRDPTLTSNPREKRRPEASPQMKEVSLDSIKLHTRSSPSEEVTRLVLSVDKITNIRHMEAFPNLLSLIMDTNSIGQIENLDRNGELLELSLQNNMLTSLKGLHKLRKLQSLQLRDNFIDKLEGVGHCTNLTSLNMATNNIDMIEGLATCPSLRSINFSRNYLTFISGLERLKWLQEINVSSNEITTLEGVEHCQCLRRLVASDNKLKDLPTLRCQPLLREVWIDRNRISTLQPFGFLPLLEDLRLAENRIATVTPLVTCPSLRSLDLSFNLIAEAVNIKRLGILRNLRNLHLNDNPISRANNYRSTVSAGCPTVVELDNRIFTPEEESEGANCRVFLRPWTFSAAMQWQKRSIRHVSPISSFFQSSNPEEPVAEVGRRYRSCWSDVNMSTWGNVRRNRATVHGCLKDTDSSWASRAFMTMCRHQIEEDRMARVELKKIHAGERKNSARDRRSSQSSSRRGSVSGRPHTTRGRFAEHREMMEKLDKWSAASREMDRRQLTDHMKFEPREFQDVFIVNRDYADKAEKHRIETILTPAAIRIQANVRGWQARELRKYLQRSIPAAIRIQASVRGFLVRRSGTYSKSAVDAAVVIQSRWRGYRLRKKLSSALAGAAFSDSDSDYEGVEEDFYTYNDDVDDKYTFHPPSQEQLSAWMEAETTKAPKAAPIPRDGEAQRGSRGLSPLPPVDITSQAQRSEPTTVEVRSPLEEPQKNPTTTAFGMSSFARPSLDIDSRTSNFDVYSSYLDVDSSFTGGGSGPHGDASSNYSKLSPSSQAQSTASPSSVSTSTKMEQLASEWGIKDPRVLQAMLKKQKRDRKLQHAAKEREVMKDPEKRLERFHKIAGGGGTRGGRSMGGTRGGRGGGMGGTRGGHAFGARQGTKRPPMPQRKMALPAWARANSAGDDKGGEMSARSGMSNPSSAASHSEHVDQDDGDMSVHSFSTTNSGQTTPSSPGVKQFVSAEPNRKLARARQQEMWKQKEARQPLVMNNFVMETAEEGTAEKMAASTSKALATKRVKPKNRGRGR